MLLYILSLLQKMFHSDLSNLVGSFNRITDIYLLPFDKYGILINRRNIDSFNLCFFAVARYRVSRGNVAQCDTCCDDKWTFHFAHSGPGRHPDLSLLHSWLHLLQR